MNYYERRQNMQDRGIDWDLEAALQHNIGEGLELDDIARAVCVKEGANDEENWIWYVQTNDGRVAEIDGWCDYTGWDCQSGIDITFLSKEFTLDGAIETWRSKMDREMLDPNLPIIDQETWRKMD